MEKSRICNFACYLDSATLGSGWKRWLTSFELYADSKGLIINEDSPVATKQWRHALLLHMTGANVQDVFSAWLDTGELVDYQKAVDALNTCFVPQIISVLARSTFQKLHQLPGETVQQFATCL